MKTEKITVSRETREFIAKAFGVTDRCVWKALAYESDSDLSKRIRRLAMQRGGVPVVIGKDRDNVMHDSDGYMRQYFGTGVMLEISKECGTAEVYVNGELAMRWHDVKVKDIPAIQEEAAALA